MKVMADTEMVDIATSAKIKSDTLCYSFSFFGWMAQRTASSAPPQGSVQEAVL